MEYTKHSFSYGLEIFKIQPQFISLWKEVTNANHPLVLLLSIPNKSSYIFFPISPFTSFNLLDLSVFSKDIPIASYPLIKTCFFILYLFNGI